MTVPIVVAPTFSRALYLRRDPGQISFAQLKREVL